MTDEINAVTEVAKTTGKAIDASREVGGFISKFIEGPLEQGMGIFEDKLKYMRWERQVALMDKVNDKMTERGLEGPTQPVPIKITIPLLQAASVEDDDNLQELWANLLVNAADKDTGVEVVRSFITILKDLTWFDAQILQKVYSIEPPPESDLGFWELPQEIIMIKRKEPVDLKKPNDEVALALENLYRLNLITSAMWAGADAIRGGYQTRLGRRFYEACTNKNHEFNG
ncbi:MAG: DUF4393 domain-containing protein [bacterium]|nr:DUF4393 domain-containing protein [bacterium]